MLNNNSPFRRCYSSGIAAQKKNKRKMNPKQTKITILLTVVRGEYAEVVE